MKHFLYPLFFLLSISTMKTSGQDKNLVSASTGNLLTSMLDFFTETLRQSYNCSNEYNCYKQFLLDISNNCRNIDNSSGNKKWVCGLDIDKQKLMKINSVLFIRDNCHYYYFYSEIAHYNKFKEDAVSESRTFRSLVYDAMQEYDASIPFVFSSEIDDIGEQNAVVRLNTFGHCFVHDNFDRELLDFIKYTVGEIDFCQFAMANYRITQNSQDLALKTKERMVVIFWKVLCQNAGVDFHKPSTTQAWEKELKVILEE